LGVAREQRRVASGAVENAAAMFRQQHGGTGALGRVAPKNRVLLRSQLLFPFGVRLLHFRNGREIFGGGFEWFHIFNRGASRFLSMRLPRKIDNPDRDRRKNNQESEC